MSARVMVLRCENDGSSRAVSPFAAGLAERGIDGMTFAPEPPFHRWPAAASIGPSGF